MRGCNGAPMNVPYVRDTPQRRMSFQSMDVEGKVIRTTVMKIQKNLGKEAARRLPHHRENLLRFFVFPSSL